MAAMRSPHMKTHEMKRRRAAFSGGDGGCVPPPLSPRARGLRVREAGLVLPFTAPAGSFSFAETKGRPSQIFIEAQC